MYEISLEDQNKLIALALFAIADIVIIAGILFRGMYNAKLVNMLLRIHKLDEKKF